MKVSLAQCKRNNLKNEGTEMRIIRWICRVDSVISNSKYKDTDDCEFNRLSTQNNHTTVVWLHRMKVQQEWVKKSHKFMAVGSERQMMEIQKVGEGLVYLGLLDYIQKIGTLNQELVC